jgi:hypothetical protein
MVHARQQTPYQRLSINVRSFIVRINHSPCGRYNDLVDWQYHPMINVMCATVGTQVNGKQISSLQKNINTCDACGLV